jgi:hypothetical protein
MCRGMYKFALCTRSSTLRPVAIFEHTHHTPSLSPPPSLKLKKYQLNYMGILVKMCHGYGSKIAIMFLYLTPEDSLFTFFVLLFVPDC